MNRTFSVSDSRDAFTVQIKPWRVIVCAAFAIMFVAAGCQSVSPRVVGTGEVLEEIATCENTCDFSDDGVCDDGGPDSFSRSCTFGSDCGDCGTRLGSKEGDDASSDERLGDAANGVGTDGGATGETSESDAGSGEGSGGDAGVEGEDNSSDAGDQGNPGNPPGGGPTGGGDPPGGDEPEDEPQVTPENGDYALHRVVLQNTSEAALMVRVGDIDNLNFGFDAFFDPFSGYITPPHPFPWALDESDPAGTDRIMVVSSFVGKPIEESDGYSRDTSRPENIVAPIVLEYDLQGLIVTGAILQIFIDDLQAPRWGADYKITINGLRAQFMESRLNVLDQDGPVGQLISIDVPATFLAEIATGRLDLLIDDLTTGAGDGYAVDFVKLLVNPVGVSQTGSIVGSVVDSATGAAIEGATVSAGGSASDVSDANGAYVLNGVPAGLAIVEVENEGHTPLTQSITLVADDVVALDFELESSE
ncbi:MAG: carboxypeptidase regulatory-like domain-containing protein [Planctomycetes bacterium]|nr:carboxypeptidase regulatory-like domain-containing protein [Planctomycetota bacterium]